MEEPSKNKSPEPANGRHFGKQALSVINTVSLLIGIVLALMHLREMSDHAEDIVKFLKISSIGYLEEFSDQFEATEENRARFLAEVESKQGEVRRRLDAGETGQTIYHSDQMDDFHAVCGFWDRSATFVELGYFDFETVSALKSFPRVFWRETAEIRKLLGENWYGKDEPLADFLGGVGRLEQLYRKRDEKGG